MLFVQHVSKQFRDIATQSVKLKRQIYLAPEPTDLQHYPHVYNPLLLHADQKSKDPVRLQLKEGFLEISSWGPRDRLIIANLDQDERRKLPSLLSIYSSKCSPDIEEVFGRSSWKDMYITQPPRQISLRYSDRAGHWRVKDYEAMTLGQLLTAVWSEDCTKPHTD